MKASWLSIDRYDDINRYRFELQLCRQRIGLMLQDGFRFMNKENGQRNEEQSREIGKESIVPVQARQNTANRHEDNPGKASKSRDLNQELGTGIASEIIRHQGICRCRRTGNP